MELVMTREVTLEVKEDNFIGFWGSYSKEAFLYILGRVGDEEAAWDIYQDSFLKAFSNIKRKKVLRFNDERQGKVWLWKVLRSAISNYLRRKKLERLVLVGDFLRFFGERERVEPPDQLLSLEEELREALRYLEELRDLEKEIVLMKLLFGMSFKEISETLKKPLGTCITIYNRALRKIQKRRGGEKR